ncbi:MAG: DUF4114 domain-containing protein [Gammaproteobacteria bacterium]|mgnify:CR=1 FL=1|nr:MAG: DUF4114 domain-containing protein [Gammaproteobacteria bacterium]
MSLFKSALVAGIIGFTGVASATVIETDRLQNLLNDITVENVGDPTSSLSSIDVNEDQQKFDEVWALTATGGSVSTLVIQLSEVSANFDSFGVYDVADPENYVEIFDANGVAAATEEDGLSSTFSIKASGKTYLNNVAYTNDGGEEVYFERNRFGYYLTQNGVTYYSEAALNSVAAPAPGGEAPGGLVGEIEDHMVAYAGEGDLVELPGNWPGEWTANEYILAWEDELLSASDRDYDDFVVMVESVESVSEPALIFGLGLGLAAFGFAVRRKRA